MNLHRWQRFGAAIAVSIGALAAGCGGGGGTAEVQQPAPQAVGRVVNANVASTQTGFNYPITIYLPQSYDGSTSTYPVIYAVDGDARFGYGVSGSGATLGLTRFEAMKEVLQRRGTNAILVGVGGTARRGTDFVVPGATAYHQFLQGELVPFVESQYRANPARRVLSGLSLGGTIVATAFFLEAPGTLTFSQFWSVDAAPFSGTTDLLALEQQMFDALGGRPIAATLFLTSGAPNGFTNYSGVQALYNRMAGRGYAGLDLHVMAFNTGHVESDLPSFEEALTRFMP
jgi:hypothetical protein